MATDDQTSQTDTGQTESDYARHTSAMSLLSEQMYPNDTPSSGEETGDETTGDGETSETETETEETEEVEEESDEAGEEEDEGGEEGEETGDAGEVEPLDEDQVLEQQVTTKINGKEKKVPVRDMVASYQTLEAAKEELDSAKQYTKEKREEWENRVQWADEQYNTAAGIIQEAENLLKQDFEDIDWKKLREQDPAEYTAKKAEYDDRQRKVEDLKQRAAQQYQQASQDQQTRLEQERKQQLQQEQDKLIERIPEWKDQEKAQAGKAKLVQYLQNEGFSEQDLSGVLDHRIVVMADKARRFDEINKKSKPQKKRVKKPTKTVKPGASQPQDKNQGDQNDPVSILYGS